MRQAFRRLPPILRQLTSFQLRGMSSAGSITAALTAVVSETPRAGVTPEDAKERRHHLKDGKGFTNPWDSWREMEARKIGWALAKRRLNGTSNSPDTTPPTVPVVAPKFLGRAPSDSLRATWLGHACYYVEFPSGFRVLFDPVFEDRCSPFSFMGPKRYTPTPCALGDIPVIDAVVISHSHYDHLSHPTVMALAKAHPGLHFFVPLGLKKWFQECGIEKATELDWWDQRDITLSAGETSDEGIRATIGCLPCQHTSARTLSDKGVTLWASWSVENGGKKVWFGGDTGYRAVPELPRDVDDYGPDHDYPHCPAFAQIGESRGPFDLGLIPIGAIMSPMHANPFDSVNIFADTKCKRAMGIHWGTWVLTEEDVLEPPQLLKQALKRKGIAETGVFDVCDIGESRVF
ncbi:MAG: hypothetical protein M1832_003411 [Thelocarpon impressellum]|nr:MAG: hypothetical protein M1832_003411 [Thelocarpon impressellum]